MAKQKSLELVTEGQIVNNSGELLVIDPCYLTNYDGIREELRDFAFEPRLSFARELHSYLERVRNDPDEKDPDIADKIRDKLDSEAFYGYPHFAQGSGYVIFGTGIGDGRFPVFETSNGFDIAFNRPNGNNLGKVGVDSGDLTVVDSSQAEISSRIKPELYCKISCDRGIYTCQYTQNGEVLSVKG